MDAILYELIYVLPIYLIVILSGGKLIGIPDAEIPIGLASALLISGIVVFINTKNKLKYLFPGSLLAMACGLSLVQKEGERLDFLFHNIWVIWMLFIAFLCLVIALVIIRFKNVKLGFTILLIAGAFIVMYQKLEVSKLAIANLFVLLVVFLVDEIQYHWKKSGNVDQKKHLIFIAPFILIMGFALYLFPVKEEPYDWRFFINIYEKASEAIKFSSRLFPGKNDDYAQVGFSENAVLAGVIQQHPKDLMVLTITKGGDPILYLKGKNFDTFDGREWTSNHRAESKERTIDVLETQMAVNQYDPGYFSDYLKPYSIDLEYQVFNTKYLFLPEKAELYRNEISGITFTPRQDALVTDKMLGYGTKYSSHYYHMNLNQEEFGEFVKNAKPINQETWSNTVAKYNYGSMPNCQFDDYIAYQKSVKNEYTEEIHISDKLRNKLDEVYDGAETDWDKCKKIEEWLGTFVYTKKPGALPEDIDTAEEYLDYFLLEKKEGYCVHYATAFVLLARAEGLPARFAEGLYVKRGASKTLMVTADMAHAWPEVYFENVGWIPFEPTPSFKCDYLWALRTRDLESRDGDNREALDSESNPEDFAFDNPYMQDDEEIEKNKDKKIDFHFVLIPILLGVAFLVLYFVIYQTIKQIRFNRMSLSDQAKAMCKSNLSLMVLLGINYKNKTLEELYYEAKPSLSEKAVSFIPCYEEILYAEKEVDETMYNIIISSRKELMLLLKERLLKRKRKA